MSTPFSLGHFLSVASVHSVLKKTVNFNPSSSGGPVSATVQEILRKSFKVTKAISD